MLERMDGTQLGSIEARERRAGRSALARRAFCRAPQRSRQVVLERWRHVLAHEDAERFPSLSQQAQRPRGSENSG